MHIFDKIINKKNENIIKSIAKCKFASEARQMTLKQQQLFFERATNNSFLCLIYASPVSSEEKEREREKLMHMKIKYYMIIYIVAE